MFDRVGACGRAEPAGREQCRRAIKGERSADQLLYGRTTDALGGVFHLDRPFGGHHIDTAIGAASRQRNPATTSLAKPASGRDLGVLPTTDARPSQSSCEKKQHDHRENGNSSNLCSRVALPDDAEQGQQKGNTNPPRYETHQPCGAAVRVSPSIVVRTWRLAVAKSTTDRSIAPDVVQNTKRHSVTNCPVTCSSATA